MLPFRSQTQGTPPTSPFSPAATPGGEKTHIWPGIYGGPNPFAPPSDAQTGVGAGAGGRFDDAFAPRGSQRPALTQAFGGTQARPSVVWGGAGSSFAPSSSLASQPAWPSSPWADQAHGGGAARSFIHTSPWGTGDVFHSSPTPAATLAPQAFFGDRPGAHLAASSPAPLASAPGLIAYRLTSGACGWIPRTSLDRVADSALGKLMLNRGNGNLDDAGRVMVDCHPTRWAQIGEFLATGSVPEGADEALRLQAHHWGLGALAERIEAASTDVVFTRRDVAAGGGFVARFTFADLRGACRARRDERSHEEAAYGDGAGTWWLSVGDTGGRLWRLAVGDRGVTVQTAAADVGGDAEHLQPISVDFSLNLRLQQDSLSLSFAAPRVTAHEETIGWCRWGMTADEVISRQLALHMGGVVIDLDVRPRAGSPEVEGSPRQA